MRNKYGLALSIAFVGFTTQFGGGFASGTQIYQYFINYGILGLITPIIAQGIMSLFFFYGMQYAFEHKTYDYHEFSRSFYGRFKTILAPLYEIEYIVMVCMAPAVAFATGGSTIAELSGLPYMVCTMIIGLCIFIMVLFGSQMMRRCSTVISILIILGMFVVLIPNIINQFDHIANNIATMASGEALISSGGHVSMLDAIIRSCVYGIFQLTAIGLMYQHTRNVKNEKEIKASMIMMYIINVAIMEIAVVGLLAVANNPQILDTSLPILLLVKTGVGANILTPIISLLILLGALSTGVNMISGIKERCINQLEDETTSPSRHTINMVIVSLLFTLLAFAISQFGLIPLVQKGYAYIGYATLFVIIIPFIIHYLYHKFIRKQEVYANEII